MMNRRNFIKTSAMAGTAALLASELVHAKPVAEQGGKKYRLSKGDVILFQGDSITNASRDLQWENHPNYYTQYGHGYTVFVAAKLLAHHPDKELTIYNRGVSGDKVYQLAERWEKDCISLKPNLVSILIGVNDYMHTRNGSYAGTVEIYETDYAKLITDTQKALPDTKIVIMEPFLIHGGTALDDTWESNFAPYRNVAKKIAKSFDLTFVPLQPVFDKALKVATASYWGKDGVHPSFAGAQLIAEAWLQSVKIT